MADGGVGGQLDQLRKQAALEAARLANINPEGGKYHGEETLNQLQETLSSATQATSNFLEGHWWGRNLKGNLKNWGTNLAIGMQDLSEYAADEADRTPTNPGQLLGWTIGNIGRSREQYTDAATDFISDIEIGGKPIDPRITRFVTGEVLDTLATAGAGGIARKGLSILDKAVPPGTGGLMPVPVGVTDDLMIKQPQKLLPNQPLKSLSDPMIQGKRNLGNLEGAIRVTESTGDTTPIIRELNNSPYFKDLAPENITVTPEDLANNPTLLKAITEKNANVNALFKEWQELALRGKSARKLTKGRELLDELTNNLFRGENIIYGDQTLVSQLKKQVSDFIGVEWHHLFGNKQLGNFMATEIARDPMIQVNLHALIKDLDLPSSGTAKNLALLPKKPHLAFHDWLMQEGLQPRATFKTGQTLDSLKAKGSLAQQRRAGQSAGKRTPELDVPYSERSDKLPWKFTGPLDVGDYGKEIAKAIKSGETDINELFSFLRVYKKYHNYLLGELKSGKYGKVPVIDEISNPLVKKTITARQAKKRK